MGLEEKINLSTINGKTGYRINKFQLMSVSPGTGNVEFVGKITSTPDTNISAEVDFTDGNLMAVCYTRDGTTNERPFTQLVMFDNMITNQDVFVNITDAGGATTECNYYIELEVMPINDLQATQLTLKSLRSITS